MLLQYLNSIFENRCVKFMIFMHVTFKELYSNKAQPSTLHSLPHVHNHISYAAGCLSAVCDS